jgi:hypothetical protein
MKKVVETLDEPLTDYPSVNHAKVRHYIFRHFSFHHLHTASSAVLLQAHFYCVV